MKIAIAGYRGMGWDFLKLFHLHPDCELVGGAERDERVRKKINDLATDARAVADFDGLLASDCDAIAIFTPPWLHAPMAVQALEAGKHVISACPLGLTVDEVMQVVDAVRRSGKIYMTAETTYYRRQSVFARQAFAEGRFGDIVMVDGEYLYRPHAYDFWIRDSYGTMPPMLYPTHSVGYPVGVLGRRIKRLTCIGVEGQHPDAMATAPRAEWSENRIANMTFLGELKGGGCVRISEMRNCAAGGENGSFIGTEGSMRTSENTTWWYNGFHGERGETQDLLKLWRDEPERDPHTALAACLPGDLAAHGLGHDGSHRFLADEFVRAVTQDRRPHNDVIAAARYCLPGIIAWESLKQDGAWLDVPDPQAIDDGRQPLDW